MSARVHKMQEAEADESGVFGSECHLSNDLQIEHFLLASNSWELGGIPCKGQFSNHQKSWMPVPGHLHSVNKPNLVREFIADKILTRSYLASPAKGHFTSCL